MARSSRKNSREAVIKDIRWLFDDPNSPLLENKNAGYISSLDLKESLNARVSPNKGFVFQPEKMIERFRQRPWHEMDNGKGVTDTKIARLLKPFNIAPKSIRVDKRSIQGYRREWFDEVINNYLIDED
jgi:hypothetical protein